MDGLQRCVHALQVGKQCFNRTGPRCILWNSPKRIRAAVFDLNVSYGCFGFSNTPYGIFGIIIYKVLTVNRLCGGSASEVWFHVFGSNAIFDSHMLCTFRIERVYVKYTNNQNNIFFFLNGKKIKFFFFKCTLKTKHEN